MKTFILSYLLTLTLVSAAPKPPYILSLNKLEILPIPINTETDTLLVFPNEVTTIIGKGLTNGSGASGSVLYVQGQKNPKTIILRHLDNRSSILMTVMLGDIAYAFRISPAKEPASVIYFQQPDEKIREVRKLSAEEVQLKMRLPSEKRQADLIELAKQSAFLKPRLPHLFKGFSERSTQDQESRDGIVTEVTGVARFENDDALIVLGKIRNTRSYALDLSHYSPLLKIGKQSVFHPNKLRTMNRMIPAGSNIEFEGILLGDGKGNPAHVAIENKVRLILAQRH